jgi:hypothetical protein
MSDPQHHAAKQKPSLLFTLPLELRERIYHYVFQTHRFLHAPFPPQAPSTDIRTIPLTTPTNHLGDLLLRYRLDDTLGRPHSSYNYCSCDQFWLLTNKAIMHEALAHYVRNAEWTSYSGTSLFSSREERKCWATRLPLDARGVRRMELDVRKLEHWLGAPPANAYDYHNTVRIANILRDAKLSLESLRFVGYSRSLNLMHSGVTCNGQVEDMFRNLRAAFSYLQTPVPHFSLGVTNDPYQAYYWVLFDYTEAAGTRLLVHEHSRRVKRADPPAEEDLANLLPEGWVVARKKCRNRECDWCHPSERETWVSFEVPTGHESRGVPITWGHEPEEADLAREQGYRRVAWIHDDDDDEWL